MDENMDTTMNTTLQTARHRTARHRTRQTTRIRPIVLALAVSVVAVLAAVTAHVVFGVGETPIVIGTLVVASIAGWFNAETGTRASVTPLGGRRDSELSSAA
jgi:fatty acid desaturase